MARKPPKTLWINWYEAEAELGTFHETARSGAKKMARGKPARQLRYVLDESKPKRAKGRVR